MSDPAAPLPFPRAKLGPSASTPLAPRPQPLKRLAAATALILIVAPAGCGKTALLTLWTRAQTVGTPVIWYRADEADREPSRLVAGLAAAAEAGLPGSAEATRVALAAGGDPTLALSGLLIALESYPEGVIVLDDAHHLDHAVGAEAVLEALARGLPEGWRLAIASRVIPLIPAITAAAGGRLAVLGRDDLLMRQDEVGPLLEAHGLAGDGAALTKAVGGWAMGILIMAQHQAGNLALLGRTPEAATANLVGRLVESLPRELRRFARESAPLGSCTAAEADVILGRTDSEERLADLLRSGLFLERHGAAAAASYRYQDLLAEVLVADLRAADPGRFQAVVRAATIYHAGDPSRALTYARATGDPGYLSATLEAQLTSLRRGEAWETILTSADGIPIAEQSFELLRLRAYAAYRRGDDPQAIEAAEAALSRANGQGDPIAAANATLVLANPLLRLDRASEVLARSEAALANPVAAPLAGWLREVAALALFRLGRLEEGLAEVERAATYYRRDAEAGEPRAWITLARTRENTAILLIELGADEEAERSLAESLELASRMRQPAQTAMSLAVRARLLLWRGADRAAADTAAEALELGRQLAAVVAVRTALRVQAAAACRLGQVETARTALTAEAALPLPSAPLQAEALLLRAKLALLERDPNKAMALLDRGRVLGLSPRAQAPLLLEAVTVYLAGDELPMALLTIERAEPALIAHHLVPLRVRSLLLAAEIMIRQNHPRLAQQHLGAAARLAMGRPWLEGILADVAPAATALAASGTKLPLRSQAETGLLEALRHARTSRMFRMLPRHAEAPEHPAQAGVERPLAGGIRASPALQLDPFGEGRADWQGTSLILVRLGTQRAGELLAFAIWQARPLAREEILEALWDGEATERTAADLRRASLQLRRLLGEEHWRREGTIYRLACQVEDAARTLLTAAAMVEEADGPAQSRLSTAAAGFALYTGDYLPWIESAWAESVRTLLRSAALGLCLAQLTAQRELGLYGAAGETAARGIAIDPLHATIRAAEIEMLAAAGQPAEAIEAYRRYRRALAEEGMGNPDPALTTMVRSLR